MTPGVSMRIVGPDADMGASLEQDLAEAQRASIAVAFAKTSALKALDLEGFCRDGRELRLLAGIDFESTELALFRSVGPLQGATCRLYIPIGAHRNFHPKIYVLDKPASRVAYIGSSNLTFGGLRKNVEANVRIEGSPDAVELVEALAAFDNLFGGVFATPLLPDFEERYAEIQLARLRAAAEYPLLDAVRALRVAERLLVSEYRGQVANERWLLVTKPQHYGIWLKSLTWGMTSPKQVQDYRVGDVFFLRVTTKYGGVRAMGMFTSKPDVEADLLRASPGDPFPHKVTFVLLGELRTPLPLKDVFGEGKGPAQVQSNSRLTVEQYEILRRAFEAAMRSEGAEDGATL